MSSTRELSNASLIGRAIGMCLEMCRCAHRPPMDRQPTVCVVYRMFAYPLHHRLNQTHFLNSRLHASPISSVMACIQHHLRTLCNVKPTSRTEPTNRGNTGFYSTQRHISKADVWQLKYKIRLYALAYQTHPAMGRLCVSHWMVLCRWRVRGVHGCATTQGWGSLPLVQRVRRLKSTSYHRP